jgi:hypothetical protein
MYWEGHNDIEMDDKDDGHYDESMFMVQMIPINGISMQHTLQEITTFQKANLTKMSMLTKGYVHFD